MHTDEFWQDVLARNAAANGRFVYSVRSTGIYCLPSCPSRAARRENVAFHADCDAAEAAGFRACKRCDPRGRRNDAALVAGLCRYIDAADTPPTLADLARRSGYSPYHLPRLFKAVAGLTPRAYAAGRRAERFRACLATGDSVTAAIYDAGYNAASRFYAEAPSVLGMSPSAAKRGGCGETIGYAAGLTQLGTLLVAATGAGICAISLGDHEAALVAGLHSRFPAATIVADAGLGERVAAVTASIETGHPAEHLPIDVRGTTFQMRVWNALRSIPAGEKLSYQQLARRIGAPNSARAVAQACAANDVAIVIPCHRVVAADGTLSGYRWGVERKRQLLALEASLEPTSGPAQGKPPPKA